MASASLPPRASLVLARWSRWVWATWPELPSSPWGLGAELNDRTLVPSLSLTSGAQSSSFFPHLLDANLISTEITHGSPLTPDRPNDLLDIGLPHPMVYKGPRHSIHTSRLAITRPLATILIILRRREENRGLPRGNFGKPTPRSRNPRIFVEASQQVSAVNPWPNTFPPYPNISSVAAAKSMMQKA
jgi:hypothetical protein